MTAELDPMERRLPRVIVAGDVCIDWLSTSVDSLALVPGAPPPMNWQLRNGRHMYATRGGAWLTADFVETAVEAVAEMSPPKCEDDLANVPPDKIIHSMLMLGPADRERDLEQVQHWVVTHFDGYAGPPYPVKAQPKAVLNDDPAAEIVLLDDAGNGFRDSDGDWPEVLLPGREPLVLYKVRRPLCAGKLWARLKDHHLGRTIALFSADELRGEGGSINRGLSWERTATDLIVSLARDPRFNDLRACPFLIVQLGLEGALLVRCQNNKVNQAQLWFCPNLTEGETLRMGRGDMSGFGSAFAAAIVGALVKSECYRTGDADEIDKAIRSGIDEGMAVMHRLLEIAFGQCAEPNDKSRKQEPRYPVKEIFAASIEKIPRVVQVSLPDLNVLHSPNQMPEFRAWRIIESKPTQVFADLAADVVRRGVDKVFADVPVGRFSDLATLDRSEIESYRSIGNLIREFQGNPAPKRPLCLAVFGAPGSGKSFGVHQVAKSLDARVEKLDFNVSQWTSPEYLVNALHRVRDHAIKGKVPLVFFDEFDSEFDGHQLGWLKYFLAPMQDGVFADGLFTHDIGKAILVFAGGTTASFAEFEGLLDAGNNKSEATQTADDGFAKKETGRHAVSTNEAQGDLKNAKHPDFISRLRGHVNVFGVNPPVDTNLLRRALVLRNHIEKKYPALIDTSKTVRIDDGVLRAILQTPDFRHGVRSIEAILEMSHLVGRTHFDPSLLPPQHQLNLHVDGNAFMALVQQPRISQPALEEMAKGIQALYLKEEQAKLDDQGKPRFKLGDKPALQPWDNLGELYRKSNREQAAHYPTMLAAVGCGFGNGDRDPRFHFSAKEVEKLARMEHVRWIEERRLKQPDHPDLVTWEELSLEDKEKDIRTVNGIPDILGTVGLRVVRLS